MISAEYTITDLNQLIYNFAFDYLKKKYVKVSSKNITTGVVTNYTYGVHYVVVDKTIELLQSVGAVGDVLRIVRETSTSEQIVSWNDASILKASDMSLAQLQQLHILEEYEEHIDTNSLTLNTEGQYDARYSRIVNLATPQTATDAVNRGYIDSFIGTLTDAQSWAVGSISSRPEGSSKYWSEQSKKYVEDYNEFMQNAVVEATGCGIIRGGNVTVSNMTATVNELVAHMPDGKRYERAQTSITIQTADATKPRIDLIYLSDVGVVTYLAGTASSTPTVPPLPSGGLSLATISVSANAITGTATDTRSFKPRYQNTGIVNVKDFGAVGDGVTDDTKAFINAFKYQKVCGSILYIPSGRYKISETFLIDYNDCTITGVGQNSILIPSGPFDLFQFQNDIRNLNISNIYISYTGQTNTGNYTVNGVITNISYGSPLSGTFSAFNFIGATAGAGHCFKNIRVDYANVAFNWQANLWASSFENIRITSCNYGMKCSDNISSVSSFDLTFTNIYFDRCLKYAIYGARLSLLLNGCNFGLGYGARFVYALQSSMLFNHTNIELDNPICVQDYIFYLDNPVYNSTITFNNVSFNKTHYNETLASKPNYLKLKAGKIVFSGCNCVFEPGLKSNFIDYSDSTRESIIIDNCTTAFLDKRSIAIKEDVLHKLKIKQPITMYSDYQQLTTTAANAETIVTYSYILPTILTSLTGIQTTKYNVKIFFNRVSDAKTYILESDIVISRNSIKEHKIFDNTTTLTSIVLVPDVSGVKLSFTYKLSATGYTDILGVYINEINY